MTRIYCSGPMTGHEHFNFPAFQKAKKSLESVGVGEAVNPAELTALFGGPEAVDASYKAYKRLCERSCEYATVEDRCADEKTAKLYESLMDADLAAVRSCDAIYMLQGWENSVGAKRELVEAINHGLKVMLQKKEDA